MRKERNTLFYIIVFTLCVLPIIAIFATKASADYEDTMTGSYHVEVVSYDKHRNYMTDIIKAYMDDDYYVMKRLIDERNEKIIAEHLSEDILTEKEFVDHFEQYSGFSKYEDYSQNMIQSCISDDYSSGVEAAEKRNKKISYMDSGYKPISFEDLYYLSGVITTEAGSSWLSMEWKMSVGEVLLNRVSSPEFPDSIKECVTSPGQYAPQKSRNYDSTVAAMRLLNGERVLNNETVVFQANFPQGSGTHVVLKDKILGNTYLCYSNNLDLYK